MNELIKLAIVDDDAVFREILSVVFKRIENIEVVLALSNGKELADALASEKQKPDVVLLDLEMPVMDGIETTEYLAVHYPDIKILILTVHNNDKKISNYLIRKGANGFLMKNGSVDSIVKAINIVHEYEYYFVGIDLKKVVDLKKIKNKVNSIPPVKFSKRELEVIKLLFQGYTNKEISTKLHISTRTVEVHRVKVLKKTNSRNIAHFATYAMQNEVIDFDDGEK
jgi:DNA-binding NarL/FixJ family response regulator